MFGATCQPLANARTQTTILPVIDSIATPFVSRNAILWRPGQRYKQWNWRHSEVANDWKGLLTDAND